MIRYIADVAIAFTLLTISWAIGYAFFRTSERMGDIRVLLLKDTRVLCVACRILKVEWFRWLLVNTPLRHTSEKIRVSDHSRAELLRVRHEMVESEVSHHVAFWIYALASAACVLNGGRVSLGVVSSVFNVLGNLYPMLVQTKNRSRIDRILVDGPPAARSGAPTEAK